MQPSPGQGQGDMQLPDIIMSQDDLQKQAEQMMKGQKEGSKKEGEKGQKKESSSGDSNEKTPGNSPSSRGTSETDQYGDPEESSEALFQLYKKQHELRQSLENLLKQQGFLGKGKSTLDSLEKLEQLIVSQGVTQKTLSKMKALKYEFLKLEDALLKKGMSPKRQSKTNRDQFKTSNVLTEEEIKRLFGREEILNRNPLPLRQNVKKKVQRYFNLKND